MRAYIIYSGKIKKIILSFSTLLILLMITNVSSAMQISVVGAFPKLTFFEPLFLTHSPDSTNRIFVVERPGRILVFANDDTVSSYEVFLDIRDRVIEWSGSELGLFSIAFHPNFSNNNYFYVSYSIAIDTALGVAVSRFSVNPENPNKGDPGSEIRLLEIPNTSRIHFGGMLQFAEDGYLYISKGDGGTDRPTPWDYSGIVSESQNLKNLRGTILRIDVDNPSGGLNYGIPPDNPFVGNEENFREEIWAWGLRNPWRFSIDKVTGELWVADVGHELYEEVNIIEKGRNYGWNYMEGFHCFGGVTCDPKVFASPILEYSHEFGCAITGGYVYRGSLLPGMAGGYIYADHCSGKIWVLRHEDKQIVLDSLLIEVDLGITSFGVDEQQELYITDFHNSGIFRLIAGTIGISDEPDNTPADYNLFQNYPNPFNSETIIEYTLPKMAKVSLVIFNLRGEIVSRLVDKEQSTGIHSVNWDASKMASGVYLYRLRAGDFVQTRKMVLLK